SRLLRPDVEGAAQLTNERSVLQHETEGTHDRKEWPGRAWMHDVIGDDVDVRKPLVRRHLHQAVLAHSYLTASLACPPPKRRYGVFEKDLRVPVVGLEEQELAPGFQRPPQGPQGLRVLIMTQDGRPDRVVKCFGGQILS